MSAHRDTSVRGREYSCDGINYVCVEASVMADLG